MTLVAASQGTATDATSATSQASEVHQVAGSASHPLPATPPDALTSAVTQVAQVAATEHASGPVGAEPAGWPPSQTGPCIRSSPPRSTASPASTPAPTATRPRSPRRGAPRYSRNSPGTNHAAKEQQRETPTARPVLLPRRRSHGLPPRRLRSSRYRRGSATALPFEFHQADALTYLAAHWREFDAVHASPPCHDHSALASVAGLDGTGHLLADTRAALSALPVPWVMENVPGAAMRVDLRLCGGMFALRTYRHRWFEFSDPMFPPVLPHPRHRVLTDARKRRAGWDAGLHTSVTGDVTPDIASAALGIDWMDANGLSQAIPPAYTRVIGAHLLEQIDASERAA